MSVLRADLPAELLLAGTREALELHTLPSSAVTTLRLVLEGTGSVIRAGRLPAADISSKATR